MVKNLANFAEDEDFTHPAAVDVAARMTSYSLAATLLGHRRITDTRSNSPSGETNICSAGQEIPAFYESRRFITVFTTARHRSVL